MLKLQKSGMTLDEIRAVHDKLVASFSRESLTFAGNPQLSDQLSALVGIEIREILRGVEAVLETTNRQKKKWMIPDCFQTESMESLLKGLIENKWHWKT